MYQCHTRTWNFLHCDVKVHIVTSQFTHPVCIHVYIYCVSRFPSIRNKSKLVEHVERTEHAETETKQRWREDRLGCLGKCIVRIFHRIDVQAQHGTGYHVHCKSFRIPVGNKDSGHVKQVAAAVLFTCDFFCRNQTKIGTKIAILTIIFRYHYF